MNNLNTKMMIFETKNSSNILTAMLQHLGVKYTSEYANKLYNEHPYKENMFGLSMMLSTYGIKNMGIRVKKEDIDKLPVPFVAHLNDQFATVYKVKNRRIHYAIGEIDMTINEEIFREMWTGTVLIAEASPEPQEPNYKSNLKKQILHQWQRILCITMIAICFILTYKANKLYDDPETTIMLCLNLIGVYIGYLLVLKQMHIQSKYADKVCTLLKRGDCNNILESSAAKLFGIVSWSELGLCYFSTNIFILLVFPNLLPYYALINICVLPYSLWSIWYQKYRAKQWCPLCLCVQVLFWMIFAGNFYWGWIVNLDFKAEDIVWICVIYSSPYLILDIAIPNIERARQATYTTQAMNSIKMRDDVFSTILKQQTHYTIDKNTSQILLGNKESDILITILTNPHCEPCADMHRKIHTLLQDVGDKICIQYIFTSFSNEFETSNKFLIAIYLYKPIEEATNIYEKWYRDKKYKKESIFEEYSLDLQSEEVIAENNKHYLWKEKNKLHATPTVLFNGYYLPDTYKIEDIKYFTNLKIDIQ